MANNTSNRGFSKIKQQDSQRQKDLSSEGGHVHGKSIHPANSANRPTQDRKRISKAGREASHGSNG